jgi:hypothetical protein
MTNAQNRFSQNRRLSSEDVALVTLARQTIKVYHGRVNAPGVITPVDKWPLVFIWNDRGIENG